MRQKELIEISITGVLVVVMIFAFGNAAQKAHLRKMKSVLPKAADLAPAPAVQEDKIDSENLYNSLLKQAESFDLKRDPFTAAPIISEKSIKSGVVLTGILWDKDKPMAIIDGNIVKVGQRVGNQTVMEIKRDRVILTDGEVLAEIKLQR